MEPSRNEPDSSAAPEGAATPARWSGSVSSFFALGDNLSSRSGCRAFAAQRIETGERVRLTLLTEPEIPSHRSEEELTLILSRTAAMTASASRPESLLPVLEVIQTEDALCCTEPLVSGIRLADYLRQRVRMKRPVSFAEGVSIFYPIALALDFLMQNGQEAVHLGCEDIWLSGCGPAAPAGPADLEPLNEKCGLEVHFSAVCVPPEGDPLIDPNATATGSIGTVSSPDELHPSCGFARLIYRVLAGRDVPRSIVLSSRLYETTTLLESKGNNLLRDLLSRQRPWIPPTEILRELCAYQAVAWPPRKAPAPAKPGPAHPRHEVRLPASLLTPQRTPARPPGPPPLPPVWKRRLSEVNVKKAAMGAGIIALLLIVSALAWRFIPRIDLTAKTFVDVKTQPTPTPTPPPEPGTESTPSPILVSRPDHQPVEDRHPIARSTPAPTQRPSKEHPWINTLGLEFVPIPTTRILMCRTLTRVQDFRRFAREVNYVQRGAMEVIRLGSDDSGYRQEMDPTATFETPGFRQGDDYPVVGVSWQDAKAFCRWLSAAEGRQYRLPTDAEWSAAAGPERYVWGDQWPPPTGTGNFAGFESASSMPFGWGIVDGYNDGFPRTSPVKQFRDNVYGVFDLAGNACQWCDDQYRATMNEPDVRNQLRVLNLERNTDGTYFQILRGSSWADRGRLWLRASLRRNVAANFRSAIYGFRCVVTDAPDIALPISSQPTAASTPSVQLAKSATKGRPYVNSLGMEFVPIAGTNFLFCRTLTRVRDFRVYATATGFWQTGGAYILMTEMGGWRLNPKASWSSPGFNQGEDYPVVCVNLAEAKNFCRWLSTKEGIRYRLPTDAEWSAGVGKTQYPWGNQWPPPDGAGNYAGRESRASGPADWKFLESYADGYARTSPVGQFRENPYGLYDMGGNVWEWCDEEYRSEMNTPDLLQAFPQFRKQDRGWIVLRGGAWNEASEPLLRSACRNFERPENRFDAQGFRCLLELP